jgi:hypothetical protein
MLESSSKEKCIRIIENKLKWGKSAQWQHAEYKRLSELIYKETGILISNSTLKRVFGKIKSNRIPQLETRNALAKFAGFDDWNTFESRNSEKNRINSLKNPRFRKIAAYVIAVLFVGLLTVYVFIGRNQNNMHLIQKKVDVQFSSHVIAASSPHTVIFNYNIKGIGDSVFIDFDDEYHEVEYEHLLEDKNTISHFYRLPDYYRVKLFTKDSVLATLNLMLESPEWAAYYIDKTHNQYVNINYEKQNFGSLKITPDKIKNHEIEMKTNPAQIMFCRISDFDLNIDNSKIVLTTRHNSLNANLSCYTYGVSCIGDSSEFTINFAIENCYIRSFIKFGDYYHEDGQYKDMSALGLKFDDFSQLELQIEDNIIKIFKDGIYITERQYYQSFGDLKGVILHYVGYWETTELNIYNENRHLNLIK